MPEANLGKQEMSAVLVETLSVCIFFLILLSITHNKLRVLL